MRSTGRYNIHIVLASKLKAMYKRGKGQSKYKDKKIYGRNGGNPDCIYTDTTLNTYLKALKKYEEFCNATGLNPKSIEQAADSRQEYVKWLEENGFPATTVKKNLSALSKATGTSNVDLDFAEKRSRDDITRNRGDYTQYTQKHFSEEKNADFVLICRCTGARTHDLVPLNKYHPGVKGSDLTAFKGKPAVKFNYGKGGKRRIAEIAGTAEEIESVIRIFETAGDKNVFDTIPHAGYNATPVHRYRSDYARAIYEKYARPFNEIPSRDLYKCTGSRKGDVFDRKALAVVNMNLGHSGKRYSLAVNNYLYRR